MVIWNPQLDGRQARKQESRALLAALRGREQVVRFEQTMMQQREAGAQRLIVTHERPWHGVIPRSGVTAGSARVSRS
jgi:hypothetical protein